MSVKVKDLQHMDGTLKARSAPRRRATVPGQNLV